MTSKIKDNNYIVIQSFMVKDLKLKGNALILYALIYGFSQTENQAFTGSLTYMAEWTSSTVQGVQKALKSLMNKKLIVKHEEYDNNVLVVSYTAIDYTTKLQGVCNKVVGGIQLSCRGYATKLQGGIQLSCNNNISNNLDIYNRYTSVDSAEKIIYSFALKDNSNYDLTQSEYDHLKATYPNVDIDSECRKMQVWLEANPDKRKTRQGMLRFIVGWLNKTSTQLSTSTQPKNTQAFAGQRTYTQEQLDNIYGDLEDESRFDF